MVKRRVISTRKLEAGMRIDQSIVDAMGRALIKKGTYLDDFQIEYLQDKGINAIYISEGEPDEEELDIEIPEHTQKVIEKVRVEDRSKVQLGEDVRKRVGAGVQYLFDNTDNNSFIETTHNVSDELVKAVTSNDAVAVDISTLKCSDEYTFKHSVDVATMAMIIGKTYGLSKSELHDIGISGLLHDVGKSKIPNNVLNKPAKLTDEEFALMKQHSLFGYKILKNRNAFPLDIMSGVLQHHEKMNGKGYPLGASGNQIHKYARIIAVADVFDALVTERPYKKPFTKHNAVEMIMAMTGELDLPAIQAFLGSIILYPVDSIVTLSNGKKAKVVENNRNYVMRPKVVAIETGTIYDLANDIKCASIIIE